ncbi:hypothetical protein ABH924_001745 [Arthrobacter sp. GAS37]|uniref:nuclear transport factor 2 family protein n=1 Tax=Arthrobacter sp. GAS37 TaxID=3156261 RepID=UPI0038328933
MYLRSRYAWAFDEGEIDAFVSLFVPTAVLDLAEWERFEGNGEIRKGMLDQMVPPGQPRATLQTLPFKSPADPSTITSM